MGALTENHRCPRGPLSRAIDAVTTIVIGGLLGSVLVYGLVEHPTGALVLAAAALGAVLANALRQAVKL